MAASADNVLTAVKCPACKEYLLPPIHLCENGHSVCDSCHSQLASCPVPSCNKEFVKAKNQALEAVVRQLKYPCMNRTYGCTKVLEQERLKEHEGACPLSGFACEFKECSWKGLSKNLANHCKVMHGHVKALKKSQLLSLPINEESFSVNTLNAYGQIFWVKCKVQQGNLYVAVQLVGTDETMAERFFYVVDIHAPGREYCSVRYSEYCRSMHVDNSDLFKVNKCVRVPVRFLSRYAREDMVLTYNLSLWKRAGWFPTWRAVGIFLIICFIGGLLDAQKKH